MISNGFQARLLNSDLVSIEETFALTPACSLFEGKGGGNSAASSLAGDYQDNPRKVSFPSISVDCYSPAYRPKALSVVRRGAVFVPPVSSSIMTRPVNNEAGASQIPISKENKLFLAFRWAGSEHSNAECASVLGDISEASLQVMRGVGLMHSDATPTVEEVPPQVEASPKDKSKDSKGKFLRPWKKSTKEGKKKATSSSRKREEGNSIKDQPFLAQLYFDSKLIPLTSLESKGGDEGKQLSTVQLVGGALLDLGVIGWSLPDSPVNDILHTITLHLWDATRPDVHVGPASNTSHQIRWGPKKTVVPNVIFHFEIVSSGPQEVVSRPLPTRPLSSTPISSPELGKSRLIEDFTIPLPSDLTLGKLDPVAEEDSYRSTDDASHAQASRHVKMDKAAAIANKVITARPRTSSLPVELQPKKSSATALQAEKIAVVARENTVKTEANESTIKNFIRKVTFSRPELPAVKPVEEMPKIDNKVKSVQVKEPHQQILPSVPRVKRVLPPRIEDDTSKQHLPIPLIRVVSTGSNRKSSKSSDITEAKRISLLGTAATCHDELVETIEIVEGLKREHIQVEMERKLLEEEWRKTLRQSMDEDIVMLKKRVEEGKREVDLLRKRVWPAMS